MKLDRVVFCDFDGTITTEDTFVKVLEKFTPEVSARLLPAIFERKMTLKEGIKGTIGSIQSVFYPELIEYIASHPIRPGFQEFIDFLKKIDVPLVVISGGLVDLVEAVLTHHNAINRVMAIHAAEVDRTGKLLQVASVFEGETELVAKAKAMAQYPAIETIAIGDSVTDINMALTADVVFARDRLKQYLDAEAKTYIEWQDFFEIRDRLIERWSLDKREFL